MIDDVVTSGGAKLEAIEPFRSAGLVVEDVLVVVDREDRGGAALADVGLRLHSVLKVRALLDHLGALGAVPAGDVARAHDFLAAAGR
jgi:orotate phosphoribosyltransferase